MKKAIIILSLLTVSAALILFSLDRLMGNPNKSLNGFNRKFSGRSWNKIAEFQLNKSFHAIAGINNQVIYLQTSKAGEILALNMLDNSVKTEKLNIPHIEKFEPGFQTTVLYPNAFITGGNARKMVKANLETKKLEVFDLPTGPVLSSQIINDKSAIVRCIDTVNYQIEFRSIDFITGILGAPVKITGSPGEDIFSHDGHLDFDRQQNKLWYTNFYSNGITRFDTGLKNIEKYKSVDTVNKPRVSVAHLKTSITYNKPPMMVNKQSFVYNGHLYVRSTLAADNELILLPGNTVIDIYGPLYEGSFLLPVPPEEFVQASMITEKKVAVLLKDKLLVLTAN